VRIRSIGELSWNAFPFVIGLFITMQGLENLGMVELASAWLACIRVESPMNLLATAGVTGLASNVMSNLPAAMIAKVRSYTRVLTPQRSSPHSSVPTSAR
jgi:Na+/H+ antiporter NhaD/arsenite permease-like protein